MFITELQILTGNIQETEKFYSEVLGLFIVHKSSISISFLAGTSKLIFIETKEQDPTYHFAFNIPCNKLNEAYNFISAQTEILPIKGTGNIADFKDWNAKAFYFHDNNNNILEFIARFDLGNETVEPFSGNGILSISEIGLVVNDVTSYCNQLIEKNKLTYFSKQPPSDNFTVTGDDNGLLIVVPNGRSWYPTNKLSARNFTKVKIDNDGNIIDLLL
ncbi:MAG TPA: VOC family protein [Panacibacter sp.]|nr:VOC family protein [Panacibacter sp.]